MIPDNTVYVPGTASAGGKLVGDLVHWKLPVLRSGEKLTLDFQVEVLAGRRVINSDYWVTCAEGVSDVGEPLITPVIWRGSDVYLPLIFR